MNDPHVFQGCVLMMMMMMMMLLLLVATVSRVQFELVVG